MLYLTRRLIILTTIISAALLAAGCSSSEPASPETDATTVSPPATLPTGHELNDAIQQPIDRAKAVEGDVMKAKDDLDARMDEQGG